MNSRSSQNFRSSLRLINGIKVLAVLGVDPGAVYKAVSLTGTDHKKLIMLSHREVLMAIVKQNL